MHEPQQTPVETRTTAAATAPVLDVRAIRKVYDTSGSRVVALDGLDLTVAAGAFVAIMGASGSGKSTLLHLIGGLTQPTAGEIFVEGENLARLSDRRRTIFRRRRMGIVFQDFNLLPTLTAAENVGLPLLVDGRSLGQITPRVEQMLDVVHLGQRARHRPDALSGGEQQRVALARALLNDPAIILADEPTGNLDSKQSAEIWTLLRSIAHEQRRTILMVTHEARGAAYADEVVILKDGQVVDSFVTAGPDDHALVATRYQELAG